MKFSTDRIRTTHGGNLPRPADFDALLQAGPVVTAEVAERLPEAVQYVVDRQIGSGVTVVNDGEYGKSMRARIDYGAWVTYDPPVEPVTWPLWAAPLLFIIVGLWLARGRLRRRRR